MATTKRHTRSKSAMKAVRKAVKESRSKEQKAVDKNLMKSIVATVLQKEKEIKDINRIRMPKDFLRNLVISYQPLLPTLTKKSLENAVAYQRKKLKTETVTTYHQVEQSHRSPNNVTPDKPTHCKEARPVVNSKERKKDLQLAHTAAYNEVTQKVAAMRQISKRVPQQAFQKIVDNTKKKYNLPDETEIQKRTIIRRIERNKMFVMVHERQGAPSPLAPIEPSIVELVISMSKIRQCLSSPEIKDLVNSCIDGTDYQ